MTGQVLGLFETAQVESSDGLAWPVAVIGGLVVVAGLVALIGEFRNWRARRQSG